VTGTKGIKIKSVKDIADMTEGGKKLARVKNLLKSQVKIGANAQDLDRYAEELILKEGGKPSFKMVSSYYWTTCVNVNDGIVHGIPKKELVFKKGDVVSVDIGMYYKGFHTDTSFTIGLDVDSVTEVFLETGKSALTEAIESAKPGNHIFDISNAIQKVVTKGKYSPVRALVGHGVGKELHEEPQIPCFVSGVREESPKILEGSVLAIEVMYVTGSGEVKLSSDGWTISTADGTISALFEETVAVTNKGPLVLTN